MDVRFLGFNQSGYIYIYTQNFGIQSLKIGREETMLNKIVSKFSGFMDT
jgi:hypothetical protein